MDQRGEHRGRGSSVRSDGPDGSIKSPGMLPSSASGSYQLTHDYLVGSLRELAHPQAARSRDGVGPSCVWPERMPTSGALARESPICTSPLEWTGIIRAMTLKREWTDTQRQMMRCAPGRSARLTCTGSRAITLISVLTWASIEGFDALRAASLVEKLQAAATAEVAPIIKQLSGYRRWADFRLRRMLRESDESSPEHLRASLALLEVDATQADFLLRRLLAGSLDELPLIRDSLEPIARVESMQHNSGLTDKLWSVLESSPTADASVLPAASALAVYDAHNPRWGNAGIKVADAMVQLSAFYLRPWIDALRPVRGNLKGPLARIFRDSGPHRDGPLAGDRHPGGLRQRRSCPDRRPCHGL